MENKKYSALEVANYIVWYVNNNHLGSLTPLKLHKILYYVSTTYVKETGYLLFDESFEKWQYGPVVKSVYHNFKNFGISHIDEPIDLIQVDPSSILGFKKVKFSHEKFSNDYEFLKIANTVIETLVNRKAFDLVEMTHMESAWKRFESKILSGYQALEYSIDELKAAKDINLRIM
ncbi:DUF4065 domain-containing protein [Acinetobacter soli]|uniref:Panacea domain-containing protein n=1 Tax=Acinetobacter soli TaxID=487316 RepID=UPI002D7FACCA|nr:type II toxin-antitoxin system antitoxin SocA domain-containing protein [Acinetobacter soli]MEB4800561.1 DUF4065 domain-containing protein [Acinetobacter soli]